MEQWIGTTWSTIGFVALGTALIYVSMVAGIRIAGRRTVSQMSAFDFVITVALGSLLATTAVSKDVSFLHGLSALVTLLVLQTFVAFMRQRFDWFRRVADFRPKLLRDGGPTTLSRSPASAQLTQEELRSKLRQMGIFDYDEPVIVILEADGSLSVIREEERARNLDLSEIRN